MQVWTFFTFHPQTPLCAIMIFAWQINKKQCITVKWKEKDTQLSKSFMKENLKNFGKYFSVSEYKTNLNISQNKKNKHKMQFLNDYVN